MSSHFSKSSPSEGPLDGQGGLLGLVMAAILLLEDLELLGDQVLAKLIRFRLIHMMVMHMMHMVMVVKRALLAIGHYCGRRGRRGHDFTRFMLEALAF